MLSLLLLLRNCIDYPSVSRLDLFLLIEIHVENRDRKVVPKIQQTLVVKSLWILVAKLDKVLTLLTTIGGIITLLGVFLTNIKQLTK
ncbi:hypothetical protein DL897_14845 [Thermoflavimicrobium daqui]|uniref:Uncharacterized protein n=1 Tax=Thermoflavimicrobium daqui TaxID=2137476 RepID=A0A364K210_9BACL|nr:hypothetical protein DL897_14845 [Thermoflavimicrobium daqui]